MEVSSGHRLTLTYNLFAVRGAGRLTGNSLAIDPTRLPLYHVIKKVISHDLFSGKGAVHYISTRREYPKLICDTTDGKLGFWCSHAYAYNHEKETPLPETLKGVDAAVWESFKALGIDVEIAPIVRVDRDVRRLFPEPHRYKYVVGHKFGVKKDGQLEVDEGRQYNALFEGWGAYDDGPIYWLTKPKHSELQIIYTAASFVSAD